jgi:large subunit ribosomal protein L4
VRYHKRRRKKMNKIDTYSLKGVKLAATALPKDFEEKENPSLLAQAIRVYEHGAHFGLAKTKTRAEVKRTKKKWYRQKGTGGARHGARSAPIFVGGGVAHGPKAVKRQRTLPKAMARKALALAIALKVKAGEVVSVAGADKVKKTKEVDELVVKIAKQLKLGKEGRFTFALAGKNIEKMKYFKNIKNVKAESFKNLNAYKVYFGGILILDKDIFEKKVKSPKKEVAK